MTNAQMYALTACALPFAFLIGCGAKAEGPELATVSGTVTYQGKPLEGALVVFLPETPGAPSASGSTDESGTFELMTHIPGDGAVIGKHRVSITARGPDKTLPEGQSVSGLPGGNTEPGDPLIPQKYFSHNASGLTAEVKGGSNTLDFELND
jgi:hypothetical protein